MALAVPYGNAVDLGRLLEPLRADLAAWVTTQKGALYFSRDPLETLELLAESPAGHRVIMQYQSDQPTGGEQPGYFNPVLKTGLIFVVSFNPGLARQVEGKIIKGDATRESLMRIVSNLRSRLMSYRWDTNLVDHGRLAYEGTTPYSMAEFFPFAAYEMSFSMVHVCPLPSSTVSLTVT